jgi:hypothetical protein
MGKSLPGLIRIEKGSVCASACHFSHMEKGAVFMYLKSVKFIVILSLLTLTACYESPGISYHEPGKYKGPKDPLLELQRSPDQQEALRKRFALVQTDR